MDDGEELDPIAILAALGIAGAIHLRRVHGGADAAIWRVEHNDATYALRVLRPEQTPAARREVAAMEAAVAGGLPVPRLHAAGEWRAHPALLLSWCAGRPLADELDARPSDTWRLGRAFGHVQAAIHALPPPEILRDHPISWQDWADPDETLRRCLSAIPSRPPVMLHLDYHPRNVLADRGRLTAVLDWANVRLGDPRADVARTLTILRLAPLPDGPSAEAARIARRAFERGWRTGYEECAGPTGAMAPFCAWAGAVMERDLAPRVGRSDLPWLTPAYLERVQRWTTHWRSRASCAA